MRVGVWACALRGIWWCVWVSVVVCIWDVCMRLMGILGYVTTVLWGWVVLVFGLVAGFLGEGDGLLSRVCPLLV